jgi:hypothetical protein
MSHAISLELTVEEAELLHQQLAYRIAELDRELVRTDQYRMQHALAEDVERLGVILERLGTAMSDAVRASGALSEPA